MLAGGLPQFYFCPWDSGDDPPLSLGDGEELQEQEQVSGELCGVGPYKQPLFPYMNVTCVQMQAAKLWTVAGGCFVEWEGCSHWSIILLGERRGCAVVGAGAEEAEVNCGRLDGCVLVELAFRLLFVLGVCSLLSLPGPVIAPISSLIRGLDKESEFPVDMKLGNEQVSAQMSPPGSPRLTPPQLSQAPPYLHPAQLTLGHHHVWESLSLTASHEGMAGALAHTRCLPNS